METSALTTAQLLQKELITFVLWHTKGFKEAVTYLKMDVSTLHARRQQYAISDPPPGHDHGPVLSQQEMFDAYCAHLARRVMTGQPPALAPDAAELARRIEVKITSPHGPAITLPLAALPPPNEPPRQP